MVKEKNVKEAEVIETKEKKVKKEKKESFFKGVRKEMKQVKWPSGKDVLKFSIATIGLAVFIMLFFMLLDALIAAIKGVL